MTTRKLRDRVHTTVALSTTVRSPRGHLADATRHAPVGEAQHAAMGVALTLAEIASLRAAEREPGASPETRPARKVAERRYRRQRTKLVTLIGDAPAAALISALTIDGCHLLRAAAAAHADVRQHATWGAIQGALVAIQRGMTDVGSLSLIASAYQWAAIESALRAKALREGLASGETLKLAALANAQFRHAFLTADAVARHAVRPVENPPPVVSDDEVERQMREHALRLEREAGRDWEGDDHDPPPGMGGGGTPQ